MPKFIIMWDGNGCGENYNIIEAPSQADAEEIAYQAWREEAEENAKYDAYEYSEELAEEVGL